MPGLVVVPDALAQGSVAESAGRGARADTAPSLLLGAVLDAVERANPRLDVARSLARAARARVAAAARPPDPQVQLGWMNFDIPSLRPMEPLGMLQLQVMQMVPFGGKLRLATAAASARADATAARVMDVSADLRARAAILFFDIYAADATLGVTRDTRRLLADAGQIAAKMYQVGNGRQADVLRANVEVARMDEEIVRMEAMRGAMVTRLNALRLEPPGAPIGPPVLPVFPAHTPPIDSLDRLAEVHRPMIRAGLLDVDAADAAARLARKEIWPDLQVGAQLARQSSPGGPQRMGSLMVGASIPLFAGRGQPQTRDEAYAMRAMAEADVAAMRAETGGAIGEAYAGLVRARRLGELYRTSVLPQAIAMVASTLAAYRVGSVDFTSLLDAQMALNQYRREMLTLGADEGKAWAELEMLTGRVLVDAHTAQGPPAGGPPK